MCYSDPLFNNDHVLVPATSLSTKGVKRTTHSFDDVFDPSISFSDENDGQYSTITQEVVIPILFKRKKEKQWKEVSAVISEWIRVKAKKSLNLGKEKKDKKLGPPCSLNYRKKCYQDLSQESRESIFNFFWQNGCKRTQWDCITTYSKIENKKTESCITKVRERKCSRV